MINLSVCGGETEESSLVTWIVQILLTEQNSYASAEYAVTV